MKIYLMYFKDDNNWLYAYTTNKELKERFLLERDSDKFIVKKIKVNKDEYEEFHKINYENELILSPLPSTIDFNISVVMTRIEEKDLLDESYHMDDEMDMLYLDLMNSNLLSKKDIESVKYLTTTSTLDISNNLISKCNIMRLFVNLYGHTFKTTGGKKIWQK